MTPELVEPIRKTWLNALGELEKFGAPHNFTHRQLFGLYAVTSIAYHGNARSLIPDHAFDSLCRWLKDNIKECVSSGADKIDLDLLRCNSGYDVSIFVRPYHDIVTALLGHPCRCSKCNK